MTRTTLPAAMTDERLESIEQAHVGDYLGHGWTQEYIEGSADEPAYYRVATGDGTTVATMPDWAGGIALFLAEAHDAVPELIAEIRRLRAQTNTTAGAINVELLAERAYRHGNQLDPEDVYEALGLPLPK